MNAEHLTLELKPTAAGAARILVVEDELIVARSLRKQLASLGYVALPTASSGEAAIRLAGELRPDLVLMDISLEGDMDGVEAAAIIRKQFRLPVVYLTAYSNAEILERAKVTEPFGYILKPYEERELHVVIETALYKHRIERRHQARERWFAATLRSIGDAVVVTDEEGRITYMNPQAERLTNWTNLDALGQPMQKVVRLFHAGTKSPVEFTLKRATPAGSHMSDLLLVATDLSERDIESCVSLITDEHGVPLGTVMVFRDVTWRKHVEEQSRRAKNMESIGRLSGGVAHSMNNLMTIVLGHGEIMLNEMKPDDPNRLSAHEIFRSATRAAALTQKLLSFGRKQTLKLNPVNLNMVVDRLVQIIRLMQADVRLELSLDRGLGLARVDQNQLEESILTLVRNACDAMPRGGRLTIQTANVVLGEDYTIQHPEVVLGPYVMLVVADTGIGMSQEMINHLFEPFFTKKTGVDAGLGLAAIYGFIKQCGGDIEVISKPGEGTSIRLYLPREKVSEDNLPLG